MSSSFKINHCPNISLLKLPSANVRSHDDRPLKLGTVCYFRFTPGTVASEYVVVSDRALRRSGGYAVIVVGSRNVPAAVDSKDLVVDPETWWAWRQSRHVTYTNTER